MAVVGMSEMGKARKRKRTLGRFCLSWEDLCGVGFFFFFFAILVWFFGFWLVVGLEFLGGGWVCFCFLFCFCNCYLFSLKVKPKRIKRSPKIRTQLICSHIGKIWLQNVLQP